MSLFTCEHAASSALSSACSVSCWSMVFGSQHSCLVQTQFWLGVKVRTLMLHTLSCCVSVRPEFTPAVCFSVHLSCVVFCVACGSCSATCFLIFLCCCMQYMLCFVLCCVGCSLCSSLAACFHVIMSFVNTQLMSILISCVFYGSKIRIRVWS